jgi:hypothetical protein
MTRDLSVLAALACALVLPAPAFAANTHIEADTYYTSGQIPSCGYDIARVSCEAATEQIAVDGVDCDGEWIAIRLPILADYCFYAGIQSARTEGLVSHFRLEFRVDDAHQALVATDSLETVPGLGAG